MSSKIPHWKSTVGQRPPRCLPASKVEDTKSKDCHIYLDPLPQCQGARIKSSGPKPQEVLLDPYPDHDPNLSESQPLRIMTIKDYTFI